jgi:hypothetical protein
MRWKSRSLTVSTWKPVVICRLCEKLIPKVVATDDLRRDGHFSRYQIRDGLPCCKGLATQVRVYRIEDAQAIDVCNAAHRDRIA